MMSTGINLVMTVIGFAVSTMFIVFVCTRLIWARILVSAASRRSLSVSSRSDLTLMERGLHGLEPLVIANFPTQKYNDAYFYSAEDAQCTVCLAEYRKDDILRILPYCSHSFHSTCIDKWLQQHSTCPVCRISLRELPEKKQMQPMFSSAVRFHYDTVSLDANSCHCLSIVQRVGPIQDRGGVEAGESISILVEDSQTIKDSGNKHVESPSNT